MTDPGFPSADDLPAAPEERSPHSRTTALVLGIIGGVFGMHRFYVGKVGTGVLMACTLGGFGLWWLYDVVLLVAGDFRDVEGRRLRDWDTPEARGGSRSEVQALTERLEDLQRQVELLEERVDFTERILARERERRSLPESR